MPLSPEISINEPELAEGDAWCECDRCAEIVSQSLTRIIHQQRWCIECLAEVAEDPTTDD